MKKILYIICGIFLLSACHHDDDPSEDEMEAERTVLVYVAAENNLSSFADDDLEEMMEGSKQLNNRQQLVVYVDKAGTNPPFLARIQNGLYVDSVSMEESLTSDPAVLEKVMTQTKQKYPAKSYGLVLWGHASGWLISEDSIAYAKSRAYGGDTGTGSSSGSGKTWMNIPSMARAIKNAMGDNKLKFIFADCCNLASIEVAYELRNQTEYFIGSPAEIPDNGAPYDLLIPDMFKTSEDFGKLMIDDYYQYYVKEYQDNPRVFYNQNYGDLDGYSVPLSVIKSSELSELASATAQILSTISDKLTPDGLLDLVNITYYGYYGNRFAYDMMHVLRHNASDTDFSTWKTSYDKAVPYSRYSKRWLTVYRQIYTAMDSFGDSEDICCSVSMFFPQQIYRSTYPCWNETIKQYQWNSVIQWERYGW